MHESIANHFSLAADDGGHRFLINPNGRHFSRICASDLLDLNADDPTTMDHPGAPDPTAWALHSALHQGSSQARCVLHVHPKYATALAGLADCRMVPIDQNTARFFNRVAIDDGYDGMALGDEAARCAETMGDKRILLMGNHGLLVTAPSVAQAFDDMYYFERAAETLITAYGTGKPLRIIPDQIAEKTARQWESYKSYAERHFNELREILDQEEPEYRD